MNIENVRERKDLLLREIERDQYEIREAIRDLRESVSVSERIKDYPKAWVFGAFAVGFLVGEFT